MKQIKNVSTIAHDLKYVEPVRLESGGKGAERPRPRELFK